MLNGGYRITKDTPYELAFDKPVQNFAVAVLMGSKYDSQPNARVSYSFAQLGSDTRVIADLAVITNPESAFERRTAVNAGVDAHDVQVLLDNVRGSLDPNSPIAIAQRNKVVMGIGVMSAARAHVAGMQGPDKGLYIVSIVPGGVADHAGLNKGDVLLTFGGKSVSKQQELAAAQATTKPGSKVKVTIWHGGIEQDLELQFPAVNSPSKAIQHTA